jgi:hypothetical protein
MTHTEWIVIGAAIALWFAQGWYLNVTLRSVHKKLDVINDQFDGLRRYLYEIDPQFDEERRLLKALFDGGMFDGMHHRDLTKQKEAEGRRTLNSTFLD